MPEIIEELPQDHAICNIVFINFEGVELQAQYIKAEQKFLTTDSGLIVPATSVLEWELIEEE